MGVAKQGRQHGDHRREQDRAAGRVRIGNLASEAAYSGGWKEDWGNTGEQARDSVQFFNWWKVSDEKGFMDLVIYK